jgi:hypothetical protein
VTTEGVVDVVASDPGGAAAGVLPEPQAVINAALHRARTAENVLLDM